MPSYMSGDRIVGGSAAPSAIPWQVSFRYCGPDADHHFCQHSCGGTILDAKTVLCAAHCAEAGTDFSRFNIMAGSKDKLEGGQVRCPVSTEHTYQYIHA